MNLIEVIKSGRPFKRKGDTAHYLPITGVEAYCFNRDELLATDWEVEEERRELTWREICDVLIRHEIVLHPRAQGVKRDLGFKDV